MVGSENGENRAAGARILLDAARRGRTEERMESRSIEYTIVECSLGRLLVAGTERGVCNVRFGEHDDELEHGLAAEFPFASLRRNDVRLKPWSESLVRYVDGHARHLDVPLHVRGSRFQRRVWDALRAIPRGSTRSYADVARTIALPRGARAVARACATNPVAVLIPCHRVVASDGSAGGYRWGTERKRALLERERAAVPGRLAADAS
jgi:AraC family transcriptional regulator of adaptative response/methylated-DNA-[protein]-cysteine methyltransferase